MIDEKKLIDTLRPYYDKVLHQDLSNDEKLAKHDMLSDVMIEIERQPKVGEWVPCSDRLPDIMRPVLVCDEQGNVCVRAITCEIKGKKYWSQDKYDVIAWRPLPPAYI